MAEPRWCSQGMFAGRIDRAALQRRLREQFGLDWHGIAHWARVRANGRQPLLLSIDAHRSCADPWARAKAGRMKNQSGRAHHRPSNPAARAVATTLRACWA